MIPFTISLPIRVALIEADGLTVTPEPTAYNKLVACAEQYRNRYAAEGPVSAGQVEGVQIARSLYRALGIDPTKTRPSSEALLRRALKDQSHYPINTLVDLCNWCSLDFLLCIGLYDRARIQGRVTLRHGLERESYEGIGKPPVHLAGRYCLADNAGPFGSPTSDSLRTCITEKTTECLMVIFAPSEYSQELLQTQAAIAARRITEFCGGTITRTEIQ